LAALTAALPAESSRASAWGATGGDSGGDAFLVLQLLRFARRITGCFSVQAVRLQPAAQVVRWGFFTRTAAMRPLGLAAACLLPASLLPSGFAPPGWSLWGPALEYSPAEPGASPRPTPAPPAAPRPSPAPPPEADAPGAHGPDGTASGAPSVPPADAQGGAGVAGVGVPPAAGGPGVPTAVAPLGNDHLAGVG